MSMVVRVIILVTIAGTVSCGSQPVKAPDEDSGVNTTPASETQVRAAPSLAERLLTKAEAAFRQGRYTAPDSDNAYDSFRSVLMIDPDNQQARAGLQAILILYSEQVRNAMAASRYSLARSVLREAESYYPEHKLLAALRAEIQNRKPAYRQTSLSKPAPASLVVEEFQLPPLLLQSRDDQLIPLLTGIAERVKENDESVMIYARTDAEGRWIYKQLKDAVPGYRVRGDIRLTTNPRIAILPPL